MNPPPKTQDDEESDDDVGPHANAKRRRGQHEKRKVLLRERLFLDRADSYHKSFMHRNVINFVVVTRTGFIVTTSVDGHLKLWKMQDMGIEFVRHYRAHMVRILGVSASGDGELFASVVEDGSTKVFNVVNFDIINIAESLVLGTPERPSAGNPRIDSPST